MATDPEDDDHTTFFRLSLSQEEDGTPVVSRAAFQLHGFAMNQSIVDGTPGFVSDDYLNAITAETTVTATELCMVGLWTRDDARGGYVMNDPMVADLVKFHERMNRDKAFCAATGGHEPDPEVDGQLCIKCHKPLDR